MQSQVQNAVDLNGGGLAGLVGCHIENGQPWVWIMEGITVTNNAPLPLVAGLNWADRHEVCSPCTIPAMHTSSFNTMAGLMGAICLGPFADRPRESIQVLDVGSRVANTQGRNYKQIAQKLGVSYTGLDVSAGENVDVVAEEPYKFPLPSAQFDVAVSGQAFEHIEFPWLTIQEMSRVLKPGGFAIVIAPSSGPQHRFPQDCWRFYPDGMRALAKWAALDALLCTTFWGETEIHLWGDTVAVLRKPDPSAAGAPFDVTEADITQMRGYSPMRSAAIRALGLLFRTLNPLRDRRIS